MDEDALHEKLELVNLFVIQKKTLKALLNVWQKKRPTHCLQETDHESYSWQGGRKMAERTGFEPVEELLAPHRFSKPAHSTTLPSLLSEGRTYRSSCIRVNPKDSQRIQLASILKF